mgnify:CR=1 FL=1
MEGKLIVFEGIDGSGKSTQIELLRQSSLLAGKDVVFTKEPTDSGIGKLVDFYQSSPDVSPMAKLLLFEADRALHVDTVIRPALDRGAIVICDRFIHSTLAYQGCRGEADIKQIRLLNNIATGGIVPDLIFWFDVFTLTAIQRIKDRDGIVVKPDDLVRVANNYAKIFRNDNRVKRLMINSATSINALQADINKHLEKAFKQWGL